MRVLLLIAWLVVPAIVLAKPTLAVAPIAGDQGGKVAAAIVDLAQADHRVIQPAKVEAAMSKLDISEIDGRGVKKLRKKLDAEIIVYGKIEKDGSKKTLELAISERGKRTARFAITFKLVDKAFKKKLAAELSEKLGRSERDDSNNDDDEDDQPTRRADTDKPKKKAAKNDDDEDRVRKKRRRRNGDDEMTARNMTTQAAIRVGLGGSAARRTLTYAGGGATPPPSIGTAGGAVGLAAEIYPGAMDTTNGIAASLGLVAEYEKTLGVGIDVPGTNVTSNVDQGRYAVGARFRAVFGASSFAVGGSYWHRHYVMDRAGLAAGDLDAPDVSYTAVALTAMARLGTGPKLGVFFGLEVPFMLSTGDIQKITSYGPSSVIAFDVVAGFDYLVTPHFALHVAADFDQVGMSFTQKSGTLSATRMVTAATDRVYGLTANLAILY